MDQLIAASQIADSVSKCDREKAVTRKDASGIVRDSLFRAWPRVAIPFRKSALDRPAKSPRSAGNPHGGD